MTIEQILEALKNAGVQNVTVESVTEFLGKSNVSLADVTPATISAIADEMRGSALTVSKRKGKLTKAQRAELERQKQQQAAGDFGTAIAPLAKQVSDQLDALKGAVSAGVQGMAERTAEDIVREISSTPNYVMQKVAIAAQEAVEARDSFRLDQSASSVLSQFGFAVESDEAA